nr:hypothetical protein [uncultured Aminipila sp.]
MLLKSYNKKIDTTPIKELITEGENNANIIKIEIDKNYNDVDLSELVFILRATTEKETSAEQILKKTISADKITLEWAVSKEFTSVSGDLLIELRGINTDGTLVIKFRADPIYINGEVGISDYVTVGLLEDLLNKVQIGVTKVEEAIVNTPYPGENDKWMVWNKDTKAYEDSGKNSAGTIGPQGPQGLQGPAGVDGKSFQIKDIYPTLEALKASYPTGNEYAYQVSSDKNVYLWSDNLSDWKSLGQIQGPQGPAGEAGQSGTNGKSAYIAATEGGYTGTEVEFNAILATAQTQIDQLKTALTTQNRGKNFLHNWYLKLPINQRKRASYTTGGFTIDRWALDLNNGTAEVSIQDGFLRVARTSVTSTAAQSLHQTIENGYLLSGQMVMLSVKHRNAQLGQILIFGAGRVIASVELPISGDWTITKLTTTLPTITPTQTLAVFIYWGLSSQTSLTGYTDYQAIKLELGDKSTLSNDLFVDVAEELPKCQKYLRVYDTYMQVPMIVNTATDYFFALYFNDMRILPTAVYTYNQIALYNKNTNEWIASITSGFETGTSTNKYLLFKLPKAGLLSTPTDVYLYMPFGGIILNAEL